MAGPEKTPIELKMISGTVRKDRDGDALAALAGQNDHGETEHEAAASAAPEFERVNELPKAPTVLNADGAKLWQMIGKQLVACGVLQSPDLPAFEQLCYMWQCYRAKAKAGLNVPTAEHAMLNTLFSQFGCNPATRRRVARYVSEPPKQKPAENRFARHAES